MSAATIFALVLQGLKLINWVIAKLERQGAITEGMKLQLAKDLAMIAEKAKVMKELRVKVKEMSDEDLHNILVD